jgi:hypothetical protein
MVGPDEGHREAVLIRRAARVHRIEALQALRREPRADLEIGDHLGAGPLGDREGIADMVAMPVGDQDVGRPLDELVAVALEGGVAGEERIDQNALVGEVEAKGGVAEPGDPHERVSQIAMRFDHVDQNARTRSIPRSREAAR